MQSTEEARHNAFQYTSQSKIFVFVTPKNVAWELFCFVIGTEKFSRHFFRKHEPHSGQFPHRNRKNHGDKEGRKSR
ncbi:hypothetical protein HR13_08505 [Porphyromonas gulae]|uniref:DUF1661 domain-containing protein n=1 Tax=Porphyromonas gulae TaxID=111105 RepID=UPI0003610305|nr:DUF1661 domain-containing protein [Porphyromonas gulae]KGN78286.1 hypothetical protein HR13_08505 [Porphyromonas gulae]KGO02226.1 hypothetical protein HQ42_07845 [Porphyromonas gulae]